jgi:N-acetylmuramoyl-L-alanine amidase
MQEQVENGYTYFVIDEHGAIGQNFPLDSWGHHAGQSSWPTLTGTVSNDLVGIEIQSAGRLEKSGNHHQTWFGETIPNDQVRTIQKQTANQQPGAYQKFTPAQETALLQLLKWLHQNNPEVYTTDQGLGHDYFPPQIKTRPRRRPLPHHAGTAEEAEGVRPRRSIPP